MKAWNAALVFALAACAGPPPAASPPAAAPPAAPVPAPSPAVSAADTVIAFFAALHDGRFEDAIELFGGSYEVPQGMNPDLGPDRRAALFERYCTRNGGVCLPVERIVASKAEADGAERFTVRFARDDGTVFELGPCCGEPDTGARTLEFVYTVRRVDGAPRVMELPPYVP